MMICFVTSELAPFTSGGIGAIVSYLLDCKNYRSGIEFHVLLESDNEYFDEELPLRFPGVTFHRFGTANISGEVERKVIGAPPLSIRAPKSLLTSIGVMQRLREIETQHGSFNWIEFPDYMGIAYATIQEKLLGRGFKSTRVAIRLHGTEGILRRAQPNNSDLASAVTLDVERKALRDADVIVTHLKSTADEYCNYYGFDEQWSKKVAINPPPLQETECARTTKFTPETNICFTSKIQELKRPDVFVLGTLGFLQARPEYLGNIVVAAHRFDASYAERIEGLIPAALSSRVRFETELSPDDRREIISKGIVIVPSGFECFCLAAYEASLSGALVILNEEVAAFGPSSPWHENRNCLKFNGSALGLMQKLVDAWDQRHFLDLEPVQMEPLRSPYWLSPSFGVPHQVCNRSDSLVTAAIVVAGEPASVRKTIANLVSCAYRPLEIIISLAAPVGEDLINDWRSLTTAANDADLTLLKAPILLDRPGLANWAIKEASGEFIIVVESGDVLSSGFIRTAADALTNNPEFDVVVGGSIGTQEVAPPCENIVSVNRLVVGEAVSTGAYIDTMATGASLMRRRVALGALANETLDAYHAWDVHMRLMYQGARMIAISDPCLLQSDREELSGRVEASKHLRNIRQMRAHLRARTTAGNLDMSVTCDSEFMVRQRSEQDLAAAHRQAILERASIKPTETQSRASIFRPLSNLIGRTLRSLAARTNDVRIER